jgi:PAS domain S-box-containing protein
MPGTRLMMVDKERYIKPSLAVKGMILIALPFTIQLVLTLSYASLVEREETLAKYEFNSKALIGNVNWLMVLLANATNAAFAERLEKNSEYKNVITACLKQVDSGRSELITLGDSQLDSKPEVQSFIEAVEEIENGLKKESQLDAGAPSVLLTSEIKGAWEHLYTSRHDLLAHERTKLSANKDDLPIVRHRLKDLLFWGVVFDISFGMILLLVYHKNIASRIRSLTENTLRFAQGRELQTLPDKHDEISELDRFFRSMTETINKSKAQLELSEKRLRNLIENLPLGLVTLDQAGLIRSMNIRATELFGSDHFVGSNVDSLIPGAFPKGEETSTSNANQASAQQEMEAEIFNGSKKYIELNVRENTFLDEQLRLLAIQDITERKEMEILKEEFTRMVSHDIRSPLASIQLTHQLMLRGDLPAKNRERLEKAEQNAARLIKMVNDLLDFEKMNSGSMPLEISKCLSSDLIQKSVDAIHDLAKERDISIQETEIQFHFYADEGRLVQVLVNLLSNAIKFSPMSALIKIEVRENQKSIEFRISDQGRGVPKELRETIFEKYKQVIASDSKEKRGIGLGLPICKVIVEQHGGRIGVMSEENKGSTFWFTIPKGSSPNS